jgi:hypothetical protein
MSERFDRGISGDLILIGTKKSLVGLVISASFLLLAATAWMAQPPPLHGELASSEAQTKAAPKEAPPQAGDRGSPVTAPTSPVPPVLLARPRNAAKQGMLDLENAIASAELIIAVRLLDVSESKIVRGGKQEEVTAQYRFEPVRILKGIYTRDVLLLTGQDLGIYQYGTGPEGVERGQIFLLLLGRNGPGYFNCNQAGSLDLSIPRLSGSDDPLLAAVDTLIAVTQERDRAKKVALLVEGLRVSKGRDAVPLLVSLQRRAVLTAQTPGVLAALLRPMRDPSPVMKEAAARALGTVLEADYLEQQSLRDDAADALIAGLKDAGVDLAARTALLDALGATGKSESAGRRSSPGFRSTGR